MDNSISPATGADWERDARLSLARRVERLEAELRAFRGAFETHLKTLSEIIAVLKEAEKTAQGGP